MFKNFSKLKFVKFKDLLSLFALIIVLIPAILAKIFIRDFWLVCEDNNEARDNGYYFFKFVRQNYPKQKIAYVINKKAVDYKKIKDIGMVIQYSSLSHWFWYIVADRNISTQKGGKPNAAWCYVFEVILKLRKKNRIFLQHGVICNTLDWLYYRNTNIYRFVVSSFEEYNFVKKYFGYPDNNVVLTGLCRFDNLNNLEVNNNQILVMPTWRQWISKEVEMKKIEGTSNFIETNYFKNWNDFLNSEELNTILKKYNKTLIFYPHRNMQKYLKFFKTKSKNIIIANRDNYDVQDLLKSSSLLITDYSSVFFDFAYMKKPIIFYQFDEKIFRKFQYMKGYFNYKNNKISKWTDNKDDLLEAIKNNLKNKMKDDEILNVDYFKFYDNNNCQRTYEMIKSL